MACDHEIITHNPGGAVKTTYNAGGIRTSTKGQLLHRAYFIVLLVEACIWFIYGYRLGLFWVMRQAAWNIKWIRIAAEEMLAVDVLEK